MLTQGSKTMRAAAEGWYPARPLQNVPRVLYMYMPTLPAWLHVQLSIQPHDDYLGLQVEHLPLVSTMKNR